MIYIHRKRSWEPRRRIPNQCSVNSHNIPAVCRVDDVHGHHILGVLPHVHEAQAFRGVGHNEKRS